MNSIPDSNSTDPTPDDMASAVDTAHHDMERSKLEAMLIHAQRVEDTAKLAGHIAHDLNNLLAPIRMATELLKRKLNDAELERYLNIIESSTSRARMVIQEIMTFSCEADVAVIDVIDVNPLVKEIEEMARDTFREEIQLNFIYHPGAPKVEIDPIQLYRSILNLLVNACDAMDGAGEVSLRISAHDVKMKISIGARSIVPGRYLCISVSDTGCGIKDDLRDKIFEPFFTTKPDDKGTGIGLASVFGIIARAGGFIDLESEVGKGSTFHLYLPQAKQVTA